MKKTEMSIAEIKAKTREILGVSDDEDLAYIDEEYLSQDFKPMPTDGVIPRIVYGSRVSYGHRDGVGPTYEIMSGSTTWAERADQACGRFGYWLAQSHWNHDNTDTYCGGSGQPAYRRVSRFIFNR